MNICVANILSFDFPVAALQSKGPSLCSIVERKEGMFAIMPDETSFV